MFTVTVVVETLDPPSLSLTRRAMFTTVPPAMPSMLAALNAALAPVASSNWPSPSKSHSKTSRA